MEFEDKIRISRKGHFQLFKKSVGIPEFCVVDDHNVVVDGLLESLVHCIHGPVDIADHIVSCLGFGKGTTAEVETDTELDDLVFLKDSISVTNPTVSQFKISGVLANAEGNGAGTTELTECILCTNATHRRTLARVTYPAQTKNSTVSYRVVWIITLGFS